jgi:hypothetical protein
MIRLLGVAMLSLVVAGPTMAAHQTHHHRNGRSLSVEDAIHFGYSSGRCGYHSGYGGLYGDGLYPGNVCDDRGSHLID